MNAPRPGPTDVKVSVAMITYNHERFIAQAIESVLMQQTDLAVELVIGEDCSTDGTRAIVRDYGERFPERIRPLLPEYNLGMVPNFIATLNACRGQYVALCEGDDYWTDPYKLQKQVDFMEANPKFAMCFHHVYRLIQATGEMVLEKQKWTRSYYGLDDVIRTKVLIRTVSVLFRNGLVPELATLLNEAPVADTLLFVLIAQHGKIGLIDQAMAVYRVHGRGVWQGADEVARIRMIEDLLKILHAYLGPDYEKQFRGPISYCYLVRSRLCADQGDTKNARIYIKRSICTSFTLNREGIDQLAMLCRLYTPLIYGFLTWTLKRG